MAPLEEQPIDKKSSRVSNAVLAVGFVSLLFGSNILNTYINQQSFNTAEIARNEIQRLKDAETDNRANRRRLEHSEEKTALKNEIIMLTYKLEVCNGK